MEFLNQYPWIAVASLALGTLSLVAGGIMASRTKKRGPNILQAYLETADDIAEFEPAVERALRALVTDCGASAAYVMLGSSGESNELTLAAAHTGASGLIPAGSLMSSEGISGLSFTSKQTILSKGNQHSTILAEEFSTLPTSVIAVPLNVIEGANPNGASIERPAGVLVLATFGRTKPLNTESIKLASAYGTVLSLLVHNLQMIEFSRETIISTLQEIADYLDAKDPFSVGHSRRTAIIAERIAQQLDVEPEAQREIKAGAQLLDLGKVAISDQILKKTSGLTEEEFDVVRGHSLVSYQICRKLRMPESVLLIVRNHHERLDGSGYPDQLRGGELPLGLRIVCVADAYDAMRCARHHRPGMSPEEALQELVKDAGSKFDPGVIEAVRDLTEAGAFDDLYQRAEETTSHLRVA